jgi:hypothetical protein
VSARAMLAEMIDGERDPRRLAELAKGRLRSRIPQLAEALTGHFDEHHARSGRLTDALRRHPHRPRTARGPRPPRHPHQPQQPRRRLPRRRLAHRRPPALRGHPHCIRTRPRREHPATLTSRNNLASPTRRRPAHRRSTTPPSRPAVASWAPTTPTPSTAALTLRGHAARRLQGVSH